MPRHVYAAKGECLTIVGTGRPLSFGALGDRTLRLPFSLQFRFNFAERQTIHDVVFR
jgi:hypothetical protein